MVSRNRVGREAKGSAPCLRLMPRVKSFLSLAFNTGAGGVAAKSSAVLFFSTGVISNAVYAVSSNGSITALSTVTSFFSRFSNSRVTDAGCVKAVWIALGVILTSASGVFTRTAPLKLSKPSLAICTSPSPTKSGVIVAS